MDKNNLEYIKVACMVIIALSLAAIAWNTFLQVNLLREIDEGLYHIGSRLNRLANRDF